MTSTEHARDRLIAARWQCPSALERACRGEWIGQLGDVSQLPFGRIRVRWQAQHAPESLRQLAALSGHDAPATIVAVHDLEARGRVERHPHPEHRRSTRMQISTAASALREYIQGW